MRLVGARVLDRDVRDLGACGRPGDRCATCRRLVRGTGVRVAGGAISLVGVFSFAPPPFNVVALWYTGNVIAWSTSAMIQRKCLKVQYGFTWSWKGATPGVTPGHYTGGNCR
jgi:hypothetical protein